MLQYIEINPVGDTNVSIIWLHGLGANGHDFEPIVPELQLPSNHSVRFIFPHAPERSVTINNGYVMPAWFDITALDRLDGSDLNGIQESVDQIKELIDREHQRGIKHENIIIAGFSQGGVIALHAAAQTKMGVGGVIALSTYLPSEQHLKDNLTNSHSQTPIFMAHGAYDPVVPITLGRMSFSLVKNLFPNSQWFEYSMEHSVCSEEIEMISAWLQQLPCMPPQPEK